MNVYFLDIPSNLYVAMIACPMIRITSFVSRFTSGFWIFVDLIVYFAIVSLTCFYPVNVSDGFAIRHSGLLISVEEPCSSSCLGSPS